MKRKIVSAILAVMMLCLLAGCDQTTATSTPAPAASSSAPAQEPDASASTPAEPDTSVQEPTEPDASQTENPPEETPDAPMLYGDFLTDAQEVQSQQENVKNYQIGAATVVLGRFETKHATEAFMQEYYDVGAFDVMEECTVAGSTGTHYRWKCGEDVDASVVDAVVTSAGENSLLFLVKNNQNTAEGSTDVGPTQAEVDGWISSLTLVGA